MKRTLMATALAMMIGVTSPAVADSRTDVVIQRNDGKKVTFDVELATNSESRMRGLMFRRSLPASRGMLFVYDEPGRRAFWMKDTYIPLDMLFFNAAGELVYVYRNAKPLSLAAIEPQRDDICAILEIAGGQAAKKGLKVGDRLLLSDNSACLP